MSTHFKNGNIIKIIQNINIFLPAVTLQPLLSWNQRNGIMFLSSALIITFTFDDDPEPAQRKQWANRTMNGSPTNN